MLAFLFLKLVDLEEITISREDKMQSKKLYVGGLSYSVTEGKLEEIFSAHGTVESARVITVKFTGRSRGCGCVEMSSGAEAQKAIEALNGTGVYGRTLTVNEARPQGERFGRQENRFGRRSEGNHW